MTGTALVNAVYSMRSRARRRLDGATCRRALTALVFTALPRVALACPVCFGESDAPLAKATNLGIMAMLGIVVAMLTAFGLFFLRLWRRARSGATSPAVARMVPVDAAAAPEREAAC